MNLIAQTPPPSWFDGPLGYVFGVAAVLVALYYIWKYGLRTLWRATRSIKSAVGKINDRWEDVEEHSSQIATLTTEVVKLTEQVLPRNGDPRPLTDRLDAVKATTASTNSMMVDLVAAVDAHVQVDQENFVAVADAWASQFPEHPIDIKRV